MSDLDPKALVAILANTPAASDAAVEALHEGLAVQQVAAADG